MKQALFILTVFLLCGTHTLNAKSWRVSNVDNTADFQTLDAAMVGISAGDTLYLEGSKTLYQFSNQVTKKVTIIGTGYFLSENPNTQESKVSSMIGGERIYLMADGITIEGVIITDKAVYIGADNVTIKRCQTAYLSFSNEKQDIINNTVLLQNYSYGGVVGLNIVNNAIISNNIFESSGSAISGCFSSIIENNTCVQGFSINGNKESSIKNNIVHTLSENTDCNISNNYEAKTSDYVTQAGASTDGKFQLASSSAGLTAGTNGSQVGAFGGSSPYILSGLPAVPHIYEIEAPTTASQENGLQVTIKIGTEK